MPDEDLYTGDTQRVDEPADAAQISLSMQKLGISRAPAGSAPVHAVVSVFGSWVDLDEAEEGYDVDVLQKRWGRPPRAEQASKVVPTRFSEAELAKLMERANREGLDRSSAIRAAVREWAHTA